MFKKINIIFGCLLICSCSFWQRSSYSTPHYSYFTNHQPMVMSESTDYSQVDLGNQASFRVAMLLPLSGKDSEIGQSLKNAATMAIGDINNNNLVVQFFDTKSSSSGARIAVKNAMNNDSKLILGPLRGDEVSAVSLDARSQNIPVISFSTSPLVLQEGIYTLGLLNDNQIKRIVKYAANQGRSRIAAVLPDNQSGINTLRALMKATQASGVSLVKVGFYSQQSMDFTSLVSAMKSGGVDFDALLIPEAGNRLKAIASMFSYYDVSAPNVLFMGTSIWGAGNLSKETELYGAVYPVMSQSSLQVFERNYTELFGERPSNLSIYAYDAIALASALANKNTDMLYDYITKDDGYTGMSGTFRILRNGQNEHSLDVVKVTPEGVKVVDSASKQFTDIYADYETVTNSGYMSMPQIVGKNATEVQNMLMNMQ